MSRNFQFASPLQRTLFGVVVFLSATAATLLLWDAVFNRVPFALYFAAVAVAAWRAGWIAGLVVGVAGVLTIAGYYQFAADLIAPAIVSLGASAIISLLTATRDRAVGALRESERQYRMMVENVRDYAMFMTDADGRVTNWNTGAERVLGWREEEIVGKPAAVIFTPEDRKAGADAKEMATAREAGHAADERWHQRKDGSRFFGTGMMMRVDDEAGRHVGFTKVLRDVTERVRADESRRAVESRWQRLAEQSPQSIQVFAPDGTVRQVNPAWERLWGITLADVPGYNILEDPQLVASGMMPRFQRAFAGEPVTIDPVSYTLDRGQFAGRQRWVGAYVYPVKDDLGRVEEVVLVHEDVTERREAEEALRESEERFRLMADAVPQIVWITDADGRALFFNRQWAKYTGLDFMPATAGDVAATVLHPDDAAATMSAFEAAQRSGTTFAVEHRIRSAAGEYRWFLVRGEPYRDPQTGQITRWFGASVDIHDRKRAEEALRQQAAVTETVTSNVAEALYLLDGNGFVTYANPAAEDMFGWSRKEMLGRRLHDLIHYKHPDGSPFPMSDCAVGQCFASGRTVRNHEDVFVHRDGSFVPVLCSMAPLRQDEGVTGAVLAVVDITDRTRAEAALRESEERFAAFMDNSPTASWITDADGRFQYVSGTYVKTFALPTTDLIGKRPSDVYSPEFAKQYESNIRSVAESGQVVEVEETAPRPDESVGEFLVYKFPLPKRSGRVLVGGVAVDVTERKQALRGREQLLTAEQAARAEAERASRLKDEFLATLSHELRTPLNAILGWSQILARSEDKSEELADGLRTIERNARAQSQIIEDLLDMSRIISGKVRLDVQRVDLALLLHQAVETTRPSADAKGIRLTAVLDPLGGPISGDPNRLQQVFWNLLTNAIKFTPKGGHVQVLLERVNSQVEASIIDTGEGIKPEFLPHVFDRFRQADASTTRRHGGLGLGLSIVKQLVELHGGMIRAKSAGEGKGSTFTVSLPLTAIHPEPQPELDRRHPKAGGIAPPLLPDRCSEVTGVRVLVVDDEPDARALLKRLLEDCNAVVFTAASAAEALETLQTERPDVLVSDIGMPKSDGYEFIRQVRALGEERGGKVPALALTAYARSEDRMRAVRAGFQMHVPKPVEPAELITMIASLAGRN